MLKAFFIILTLLAAAGGDRAPGPIVRGNLFEPFDYGTSLNASVSSILQPLDHFDNRNLETLQQRYWSMSEFFIPNKLKDDIIFLFIGGASAADEKWITNPNVSYLQLAEKHKAQVFMLEHRFYGDSVPSGNQSIETLNYLSSKQALADIANFIQIMNPNFTNPRWVTFGGFYGGTLSALFREKYPDHTVGAVASSAPLNLKINFFEYLQVVQRTLKQFNPACSRSVETAFENIQTQLYSNDRTTLNGIFRLSKPFADVNPKDFQTFIASLIGAFKIAVQNGGNNAENFADEFGVTHICEIMMNNSFSDDRIENVQRVFAYMSQDDNAMVQSDYSSLVKSLKDESFENFNSALRSWFWQTCTEFGFFQSTDLGRNIFRSAISVDFYIDLCTDVFGLNRTTIDASVAATQELYGGLKHFNGTKLVLINGSHDPWHALSLYFPQKKSGTVFSYLINSTTHCADMYPPRGDDLEGLQNARKTVSNLLSVWI